VKSRQGGEYLQFKSVYAEEFAFMFGAGQVNVEVDRFARGDGEGELGVLRQQEVRRRLFGPEDMLAGRDSVCLRPMNPAQEFDVEEDVVGAA